MSDINKMKKKELISLINIYEDDIQQLNEKIGELTYLLNNDSNIVRFLKKRIKNETDNHMKEHMKTQLEFYLKYDI